MAVPDFQSLMLPVLQGYADGKEQLARNVRATVASRLGLTPEDIAERLPTGPQTRLANRVAWAHSYLKQAGLLESPRRGQYRITDRGRQVLAAPPSRIDISFLEQYSDFQEFRARKGTRSEGIGEPKGVATAGEFEGVLTPDEQLRAAAALVKSHLAAQLLERVKQASPTFFENLVIDLLVAIGGTGFVVTVVPHKSQLGLESVLPRREVGADLVRAAGDQNRSSPRLLAGLERAHSANAALKSWQRFSRSCDVSKEVGKSVNLCGRGSIRAGVAVDTPYLECTEWFARPSYFVSSHDLDILR